VLKKHRNGSGCMGRCGVLMFLVYVPEGARLPAQKRAAVYLQE